MSRAAVLLLSCCALVAVASAYPTRWDPCSPPTIGQGDHFDANGGATPLTDRGIKVRLTYKGKATATYCPGRAYKLKITWPTTRHAFITTKLGTLSPNDGCSGKRYRFLQPQLSKSWVAILRVPCSAKGSNVIKVVTAEGSTAPYKQISATIRQATKRKCRSTKCPAGK